MHEIIAPGRLRQPLCAPVRRGIETELRYLPSRDLEWLRRGLRRQLAELPVGSPASRLVGRLCRLARSELRRRQASDGPCPPKPSPLSHLDRTVSPTRCERGVRPKRSGIADPRQAPMGGGQAAKPGAPVSAGLSTSREGTT
jgi:hypothetical protein